MKKIWKMVLVVLVVLAGWWLAVFFNVNVGAWISRILGLEKKRRGSVLDAEGNTVGEVVPIVIGESPLRDKSVLTLENGDEIQLPEGVRDTDVATVTIVGTEYHIKRRTGENNLTSIFD